MAKFEGFCWDKNFTQNLLFLMSVVQSEEKKFENTLILDLEKILHINVI